MCGAFEAELKTLRSDVHGADRPALLSHLMSPETTPMNSKLFLHDILEAKYT